MKPQVKKKWVAALTSGKYRQAKEALKTKVDGKFAHCCLGVLCELYIKEVAPTSHWKLDETCGIYTYKGAESYPHQDVMKWAGLERRRAWDLVEMNDKGVPFNDIAKKINTTKVIRWANQYGRGVKRITF